MTEAIDDCTEAINLDGSYLKAYIKRAKWYAKNWYNQISDYNDLVQYVTSASRG